MKTKLAVYAALVAIAYLVYKQWTRTGSASFGPLTPLEVNPYGDPNAKTHPPNDIGAPGSDTSGYAGKSLTGLTEAEEYDTMNRLRQTAPVATRYPYPPMPGMAILLRDLPPDMAY